MRTAKIEIVRTAFDAFHTRIRGRNGAMLNHSENLKTKRGAYANLVATAEAFHPGAYVVIKPREDGDYLFVSHAGITILDQLIHEVDERDESTDVMVG